MRPENEARLKKIRGISGLLRVICKMFLALIVWIELLTLAAAVLGRGGMVLGQDNYYFNVQEMSIGSRIVIGVYFTLQLAGWFFCIFCLHQLLGKYSRGEIFTQDSCRQIRRWGLACVLWGAMQFFWVYVPGAVLPHTVQVRNVRNLKIYGQDVIVQEPEIQPGSIRVNGMHVQVHGMGMMGNGLVIVVISWFMEMAVEMREENELTV